MIRFENVSKRFPSKDGETIAVNNVNLEIEKGEIFGIIGFSGAGKSTLVRHVNLLEYPTCGNVYFEDFNLTKASERELRKYRQKIGMIFQQFNLLAQRNVVENIVYPLEIAGAGKKERLERAEELLRLVGLEDKKRAYPAQLSGGQKQRVAIARAMVNSPKILLADEPTGALDSKSGVQVMELFRQLNSEGVTVIMITHAREIAEHADRIISIFDGEITSDSDNIADVDAAFQASPDFGGNV